jgi:DNA processing protein
LVFASVNMIRKDELQYWLGVAGLNGLGIQRMKLLLSYFGNIKAVWRAKKSKLIELGVPGPMVKAWDQWRKTKDLNQEMNWLAKGLIKLITIEDKRYPKLLKEIDTAPFLLFVKGAEDCLNKSGVAVVGSRQMSEYGRLATARLVAGLVEKGLVIVSGLARGVDSLAHRACLKNHGLTVAILGHGLERIYPQENQRLAEEIVASGGALVSEYPLGYPISQLNFPARNRIIAGLSLGVLVVEGRHKSGSKITAGFAAEFGREVWAVPGRIDSPQSEATADLIKEGAKPATRVEDILEELILPSS